MSVDVAVLRLDTEMPLPATAHPGDAGMDLRAREGVRLPPGGRAVVPTGIAVAIAAGHAGMVLPRSGLAARHGIGLVNAPGLIDSGYRGEVAVVLINHGSETVEVERGDRVAQLVVVAVPDVLIREVSELPQSRRGSGGFGSTGQE
ncbi:MAG: dUTP diphosphatase [Acidimicrobiia bacterium]